MLITSVLACVTTLVMARWAVDPRRARLRRRTGARDDIAAFLVGQLTDETYLQAAPTGSK